MPRKFNPLVKKYLDYYETNGGGGGGGVTPALSGSNGSFSFSTATFGTLNGISFYTSNGSMVASHNALTSQSVQTQGMVSVLGSTGAISFGNANGVTFGGNASTITASHNGLTSQSNQALSGSNGSFTFQTATFGNLNGMSFYTTNGSLVGSYTVPTVTNSSLTMQAGASTLSSVSRIAFNDANGVSFGASTSNNGSITITASHNGLTSQSNQAFSAAGGSSAFQTLTFANGSGVSFSNTNGSVGATVKTDYAASDHSHGNPTLALTNLSGTTASNSAGLTLSLSAAAGGGGADGYNILAAGTQTANTTGSVKFADSNGITFGMSASTQITASHNGITQQSTQPVAVSGQNGSFAFSTLSLSNANGISFGTSAGSAITASHNALTSQSNQAVSAANGSSTFQTLSFNDANGVSWSTAAGGIQATVKTDYQSSNANYLTSQSNQAASGSNGSFTFQTLSFTNANGLSFGTSAGGAISASYTVPTQSVQPGIQSIAVSNTTYTTGQVSFSNANGMSFGSSAGGAITASYTVPTVTNSSMTVSDSATSGTLARLAFTNQNGVTLSLSTGAGGSHTIVGSHNGLTSQSNQNITAGNGGFAFQTLSFSNLNGISFSTSAGSAIVASHNGLTTARASNDAIGLNTAQSNVTWTVNSSGISLDARGYAGTGTTFNGANVSGSMTVNSNGVNLSLSAGAGGGVTPVASASNGSFSFTTLAFSNANNVTFGTSAGSIITASVAAPGAAAENNAINLLGANTAGNTTATGSTIGWSGQNITLSGTNASQIVISAPATSSLSATGLVSLSTNGSTISIGVPGKTGSYFDNMLQQNSVQALTQTSVSTQMFGRVILQPLTPGNEFFPFSMTAETMRLNFTNSGSSNISGAFSSSWYVGIYTRNNSTQLSLLNSVSTSYGLAANANNSASFLGARWLSFHSSQWSSQPAFTEGRYFFAILARTSSNSYASHSLFGMHLGASVQRSGYMAVAGASNTSSNAWHPFMGVHSLTTHTALPASIANTEINKASSYANFIPQVVFDAGLGVVN